MRATEEAIRLTTANHPAEYSVKILKCSSVLSYRRSNDLVGDV
jgi:hypothetical protein